VVKTIDQGLAWLHGVEALNLTGRLAPVTLPHFAGACSPFGRSQRSVELRCLLIPSIACHADRSSRRQATPNESSKRLNSWSQEQLGVAVSLASAFTMDWPDLLGVAPHMTPSRWGA
jgi:hypothetical protein